MIIPSRVYAQRNVLALLLTRIILRKLNPIV